MDFGKLFDTLKGPLLAAASTLIPHGPLLLGAVNAMLPDDKQLPTTVTGADIRGAVNQLTPEQRGSLMEKQIDLDIAVEEGMTERYKAMASSDGQETRAKIVNKAMNALIVITVTFVAATSWVYIEHGADKAFSGEMAAVFGVVTGTFAYVVRAYFGDLRTETKSRHQTIDNKPAPMSVLSSIISGRIKG